MARRRSFALAAAELHLTASAVSHQVARLESHLGVRLFERSAHGVRISAAGEQVSAAGIVIDTKGSRLLVSNRGHNSIASFRVDPANGLLEYVGVQSSNGRTPRFFTFSPDERFLFALNEESDSIVCFQVHTDGRLSPANMITKTGSPVCMVFSPAAGAISG